MMFGTIITTLLPFGCRIGRYSDIIRNIWIIFLMRQPFIDTVMEAFGPSNISKYNPVLLSILHILSNGSSRVL